MVKAKAFRSWNLNADNLEESLRFYEGLLGAEVGNRHQVRGVDVVRLNIGNVGIGLFDASSGLQDGVPHHTIEVDGPDDPEDLKRELEAKGYPVDGIRSHAPRGAGYSVYVCDPSGNRIELSTGDG